MINKKIEIATSKEKVSGSKDHLSPELRSVNMSKIRQKDTKPETLLRQSLHKKGFRFRKNVATMPGKPDIVMKKYKTVIFLHGCFWHRHNCRKGRSTPSTRQDFWQKKFQDNVRRDEEAHEALLSLGWNVITIWECELKNLEQVIENLVSQLLENLNSQ